MMRIEIRRGVLPDLSEVQRLNRAQYEHSITAGYYPTGLFDVDWPFSQAGEDYFTEHLRGLSSSVVFVAIAGTRVVGCVVGRYERNDYRLQNPLGQLELLFVEEAYRNQGIGTLLAKAFINWARVNHVARLRVGVLVANDSAQRFYRKLGFTDLHVFLEKPLGS